MSSRVEWTHPETSALLDLWKLDHIQKQFTSMCRKKPIWEDISSQLKEKGISKTAKQCEVRIHTLTTKYRKIVKANNESGATPKSCPFFADLDEVLGTKPSTAPPCLIDSGKKLSEMIVDKSAAVVENISIVEVREDQHPAVNSNSDNECNEPDTAMIETSRPSTSAFNRKKSDADVDKAVSSSQSISSDKRGKKLTQTEDLLNTLIEMQQKSEERFYDFERKRMELELKEEEKRREREDQQDKKQQDFLLELAKIFAAQK